MKKYLKFIKMAFQNGLAYRTEYFVGMFRSLVILLVQLCVWQALLGKNGQVANNNGVITLREMTTYVLMSTLISTLIARDVIEDMSDRISNGQISMDLIKPMNFQTYTFCNMIGQNLFSLLFQLLPILAIGLIFIGINIPSLPDFLLFCLTLINALIIMFLITYSMGLMAFWYTRSWQVNYVFLTFVRLFSGMIIPLWFFPQILVNIGNFLPFRLMYYVPISIFLDKITLVDCLYLLLQQFIWIGVLYIVTRLVWRTAINKTGNTGWLECVSLS